MANTARVRIAGTGARCCEQQDSVPRWVLGGDRGLQDTTPLIIPLHTRCSALLTLPRGPSTASMHSEHLNCLGLKSSGLLETKTVW